jgi:hypothetical protein
VPESTTASFDSDHAAETGTEHLTGPETPVPAEYPASPEGLRPPGTGPDYVPDSIPVLVTAEPAKPWYRRRMPWPWRIVTGLAGFAAGWLVVAVLTTSWPFAHSQTAAEAILAHDGYSGAITISGSLWQQALQSSGGNSGDVAAAKATLSSGTVGFKGSSTEIVFGLTPAGAALIPAELPYAKPGDFGPGNTAHMDHGYFVIDGPASQLGGPSQYQTRSSVSLTAAVTPAPVTWHVHEHNVPDTTDVAGSATVATPDGPVWAQDNLERTVTAVQDAGNPQLWHVTVASTGSFASFANPIDGNAWAGSGSVKGSIEFDVTSPAAPAAAGLPAQLNDGEHSTALALDLFGGQGSVTGGGHYQFTYNPVPVPGDAVYPSGYLGITYGTGHDGLTYTQAG